MKKLRKNQLFSVLVLLSAAFISGNTLAAEYPFQDKLQQCETAFEKMHSGNLTQAEAWKVRLEHKMLVREILENLNKRNHSILKSKDDTIAAAAILENFVVMGSLLEMLATDNLRATDEWGYPLHR